MKRWHGLTEQELMVIINALQSEANDNKRRFIDGEEYEKGNPSLLDDAQEQEELADKLLSTMKDIWDPTDLDGMFPRNQIKASMKLYSKNS
tara:strand:- start:16 stop:288 length:273 start_codon:yes stop_codon:yes gene_type:complete